MRRWEIKLAERDAVSRHNARLAHLREYFFQVSIEENFLSIQLIAHRNKVVPQNQGKTVGCQMSRVPFGIGSLTIVEFPRMSFGPMRTTIYGEERHLPLPST